MALAVAPGGRRTLKCSPYIRRPVRQSWRRVDQTVMKHAGICCVVLVALAFTAGHPEAHKPITSPYTYNEDVFPILRDRCGRCHVAGGVAPMSLMTAKDAVPWGESIRTELIAGHMPPWSVDAAPGRFKNVQTLTARELNILLTWVTGGNPVGNPEHAPAAVTLHAASPLGTPDLELPLSEVTLAADTPERTHEFTLPTAAWRSRWVRAVDFVPGTPAVVRSATVFVKPAAASDSDRNATPPERVLAVWVPGDDPVAPDGTAFHLPADAEVAVRVHYKKTWEYERMPMTDRSTVRVYLSATPATELRALTMSFVTQNLVAQPPSQGFGEPRRSSPDQPASGGGDSSPALPRRLSFSRTVEADLQVLALYPDGGLANVDIHVKAIRPDGSQVELIRFRPQPDWARRYWFERPIVLPRGSRIEAVASFEDALLPPGAAPPKHADTSTPRLTLNVIPSM
jgi:hypothetical protein